MAHNVLALLTGPIWAAVQFQLSACHWKALAYMALGSSLLMRAQLARQDLRHGQARGDAFDAFLYFALGLMAAGH